MATYKLKLKTASARIDVSGDCSETEAFALYMLICQADTADEPSDSATVTEYRAAMKSFLGATAKYHEACGGPKQEPAPAQAQAQS